MALTTHENKPHDVNAITFQDDRVNMAYGQNNKAPECEADVESKLLDRASNTKAETAAKDAKTRQEIEMTEQINQLLRDAPLDEDVKCGFWLFKGGCLQRFANQNVYVILYGLVGCILAMTYAYFNGTITTIEKRFKIPSKNTGIIAIGNNISQMVVSAILSYYAGKGHRPRWISFGILTIVTFCWLTAVPHFLYGPGEDALALTAEYGAVADINATLEAIEKQRAKSLCHIKGESAECEVGEGNLAPQLVFFLAQFISGIGSALYYTLGVSYMDDNTKKSKTPALLSLSYFFHMLGPAIGYAMASFCLRLFIQPELHPVIDNSDPRWMGAWWLGWLLLGALLFLAAILFSMLPKELPRAAARRAIQARQKASVLEKQNLEEESEESKASFGDMLKTFKRLVTNKTLMCNHISSFFYFFGYTPYWIFTPKYIEIQYKQSASTSSMVTGTVALVFSAIGVLLSGIIISRFKPRARYMAAWNVIVGILTVMGMISYAFIGCPGNEQSVIVNIPDNALNSSVTCNSACNCDYVYYSPVCGENNMTYISPCHAGCQKQLIGADGKKIFYDCACISNATLNPPDVNNITVFPASVDRGLQVTLPSSGGFAHPGACTVDCFKQFVTFLAVMCCLKFLGASGRASNFLVTVRCVSEQDKTAAMGFGMMLISLLTFIPSPIFFGWVIDNLCLVWGKTCSNTGNCWLYDPEALRYTLNLTASVFVVISVLFDGGVWYYVKDLKIFDDEVPEDLEMEEIRKEQKAAKDKSAAEQF